MTPRFHRLTIALLVIGAIATTAYWLVWFFGDRAWLASLDTPAYYTFENAFPAADAWLAFGYAASAWTLRARRPAAVFWLIAAGSASIYLGLMDVLFDLQNGVYAAPDVGAVAIEAAINVASLGLGAWLMAYGWRHRRWFLG